VLDPRAPEPDELVPLTASGGEEIDRERDARSLLSARAAELRGLAPRQDVVVAHGEPWKAIVEEAERGDVDLVVVGTHDRTGPSRWLLGSVAEKVVRECACPVLTVRGDGHGALRRENARVEPGEQPYERHDSTVIKIDSARSPRGAQGQKYLAGGVRVAMRLWEHEAPGDSPESERDYEVVGYVLGGEAELHIEGQVVRLEPGDSYVVPRRARHHYRVLAPFSAIEATSPPGVIHGRDEQRSAKG
jgi:quercetin dioxygenase-like cupin family protein